MRPLANESPLLLPLGRPSNLCARQPYLASPYSAIPNFVRLLQINPCPLPPRGLHCQPGPGRQEDIVMTPARWRCEISEAFAPGHLPVHSSPPTASAGLPLPQSHHLAEEPPSPCVTSLPAHHRPAFPHTVAIVEAHQMRRPRPHLWASGVAAASVPPALDRTRCPASPDQAHVALMTAVPTLLRFRSRKTRQVGLRNGRSRHGPAAPLPLCVPPSQSPSCGPLAAPQCRRGLRYYCTAERPLAVKQIFHHLPSTFPSWITMPGNRQDGNIL